MLKPKTEGGLQKEAGDVSLAPSPYTPLIASLTLQLQI